MVTNWRGHWDQLPDNRAFFTKSMFRHPMNEGKLVANTNTVFIKRNRETRKIEGCWEGRVSDFSPARYKDLDAISFRVAITDRLDCPSEYLDYSEGWYCEDGPQPESSSWLHARSSRKKKQAENKNYWDGIKKDFGISKRVFGKNINFVKSQFRREIIFRDVEQAYFLARNDFNKPAVILAGGVIEELLRLFLDNKNENVKNKRFEELIEICQKKGFLKEEISNLASAIRRFRNSVHLAAEKSKKYTISKATASATVALIFTIVNDFQKE